MVQAAKNSRILAFDLDDTLAPSKLPVTAEMAERVTELLGSYDVCVISGGSFDQFRSQLIDKLPADAEKLARLHIMPTCGTRYYRYANTGWRIVYAEDFTEGEKSRVIAALQRGIDASGLREPVTYGEVIEDRGSQITFSALGQEVVDRLGGEGVRLKRAWDPDGTRKAKLCAYVGGILPDFEVRAGGTTSVDITKKGIDKAYGIRRLMETLGVTAGDVTFFGDQLDEGGNDYPVRATEVHTVEVKGWEETYGLLKKYIE